MKKKITIATMTNGGGETLYDINNEDLTHAVFESMEYITCATPEEAGDVIAEKLDFDDFDIEFGSISFCTYGDVLFESNLRELQEKENKDCIVGRDNEGYLSLIDNECYDFLPVLYFHDGNNFCCISIENVEEIEIEELEETTPDPAFYFSKTIRLNNREIEITQSNTSGSITPYWTEDTTY